MALYLGTIGSAKAEYDIVAFTKDKPFRWYSVEEIADEARFNQMTIERFKSLQSGRAIYCTAINPIVEKGIEINPHDERYGTVHIAAINKITENISCLLSVAVDTGEMDNGELIGLPLENRWKPNGYPMGDNLDKFRECYNIMNRGEKGPVRPWQIAEMYRHLRVNDKSNEIISRIGLYVGFYHLFVRDPRSRCAEETSILIFDAIPKYFNLYRFVGAAVLRNQTVNDLPQYISPGFKDIEKKSTTKELFYNGMIISRDVETLLPLPKNTGGFDSNKKPVAFLDGVIDMHKLEDAIKNDPQNLHCLKHNGMSDEDMKILRMTLPVVLRRQYEKEHSNHIDISSLVGMIAPIWNFNEIGV